MEKERVKELNDISKELGIPQVLLRIIVAYAVVYTKLNDIYTPEDIVYNIAKESLYRIDLNYVKTIAKPDNLLRPYGKSLVEEVAIEYGIYSSNQK